MKTKLINLTKHFEINYYFDLNSFNIGIGFCKTTGISGWKYMLSFDLGFLSIWVYYVKILK
jgi:hypothetical protein